MDEYSREPCPWRIMDDVGGAFSMGAIGGGIFHMGAGFKNAPQGLAKRLYGGATNVMQKAPITGGQFAAWGGMFSLVDCGLVYVRQKEDPWNGIMSGAITGGLLMVRSGPGPMAASAVLGGFLLGLIEGISIGMNRMMAWQFDPNMVQEMAEAPSDPNVLGSKNKPSSSSSQPPSDLSSPNDPLGGFTFSSGLPQPQ